MKRRTSRSFVLLLVGIAAGAASLLAPEPAAADKRLFAVQRTGFGAPFPRAVALKATTTDTPSMTMQLEPTTPMIMSQNVLYGGAGKGELYLEPYSRVSTATPLQTMLMPSIMVKGLVSTAIVTPMNLAGAKFTLPPKFIYTMFTSKGYASTAFMGYTSITYATSYNAKGVFRPNNPYGAMTTPTQSGAPVPLRVVFPTVNGNVAIPNKGLGYADLDGNGVYTAPGTTTFDGRYAFSRAGSIFITPGPNRFGGTMRFLFNNADSLFYQYIFKNKPLYFKAYGSFTCEYMGLPCTVLGSSTPGPAPLESRPGQVTSSGMVTRFLLQDKQITNTAGTTMLKHRTMYRLKAQTPEGDFITSKAYYLHTFAPWTTGQAEIYNINSSYFIKPLVGGYDKNLASADLTVTRTTTDNNYKGLGNVTHKYYTAKQKLENVTRVVSMVRPRFIQTYLKTRFGAITNPFSAARMARMKVYFIPEPGALLVLGSGIAGLAGLYLLRRR